MTKRNWGPKLRSNSYENSNQVDLQSKPFPSTHPQLVFPSCIGLAAGLDKDGIAISQFMDMGFGYVHTHTLLNIMIQWSYIRMYGTVIRPDGHFSNFFL